MPQPIGGDAAGRRPELSHHRIQHEYGFVSSEAMEVLAEQLRMFPAQVYGAASFYEEFRFEPPPATTIRWYEQQGLRNWEFIGADRIMWESDFPHPTSLWPDSSKYVELSLAGVPDDARRKILVDNARSVYKL